MVKTQLHLKVFLLKTNLNTYTRNKSIFIPKKCFSTICQQAISHRGPAYWNCIPFDLKNKKQSVQSFTLEVYKYLLQGISLKNGHISQINEHIS